MGNYGGAAIADMHALYPYLPLGVGRERPGQGQALTAAGAAADTVAQQERHVSAHHLEGRHPSGLGAAEDGAKNDSRVAPETGISSTPPQGVAGGQMRRVHSADTGPGSAVREQIAKPRVSHSKQTASMSATSRYSPLLCIYRRATLRIAAVSLFTCL